MSDNLPVLIGGGSGGPPAPSQPIVQADNLKSEAVAEFVDALSEGELEGFATADPLESIYLENTPIRSGGVDNFKGVTFDYRLGTQNQTHFESIRDRDNPTAVNEFAVGASITLATSATRTINSPNVDATTVTVHFNALYQKDVLGDVIVMPVTVKIEVRAAGGSWSQPNLGDRNVIVGKTMSPYRRSFTFGLKQFGSPPYDIRVSRTAPDRDANSLLMDMYSWVSYTEIIYAKLRFPNTALAKMTFDAKHFQSIPRRGFLMKGIKVKIPHAGVYNSVDRTYSGAFWDGTFTTAWTRNPAWILYDILTESRYGLGDKINPDDIDKWELFQIAKRCDERVPDGYGGTECRYSLDLYLQENKGAKQIIQDIASSFDGMAYWGAGKIFVTQDRPKTVSAIYTNANVVNGTFNYAGTAKQVRYTAALVQWNDPADFYRVATEYVEDSYGIERYGYQEISVTAIGCTSRGQAHRSGKRILATNRLETDTVIFAVGLEGVMSMPGSIIAIRDTTRFIGDRWGGRVANVISSTAFTLDSSVTLAPATAYHLGIYKADGSISTANITNSSGTHTTITTNVAIGSVGPLDTWVIFTDSNNSLFYRVLSVVEGTGDQGKATYTITAIQYDPSKYDIIDSTHSFNLPWDTSKITGVIPPSNLVVHDGGVMSQDGIFKRYLDISWTPSTDKFLKDHELSYAINQSSEYVNIAGLRNSYRIEDVGLVDYHINVKAKNMIGLYSAAVTTTYSVTAADTTPPGPPTYLTAYPMIRAIYLEWINPSDRDLDLIEIWMCDHDLFADARIAATTKNQSFKVEKLAPSSITYYFWVTAVDRSGNRSVPNAVHGVMMATLAEADYMVALLEKKIGSSALNTELGTRVNLIDGSVLTPGTIPYKLAQEASDRTAAVYNESVARSNADGVISSNVNALTTTVGNQTTTIATQTSSIDGIKAKYTVKIDNNGYVSGYGLMSEANNGVTVADFAIRADRFSIASPTTPTDGVAGFVAPPVVPFMVLSTPTTIDGTVFPAGAYMKSAMITKLTASQIDTRGLTVRDSAGNVILGSGTALDFANVGGSSKPANNATVGATWGSNISGKPSDDELLNSRQQSGGNLIPSLKKWVMGGSNWVYTDQSWVVDKNVLVIQNGSNWTASSVTIPANRLFPNHPYVLSFKAWSSAGRTVVVDLYPDQLPESYVQLTGTPTVYSFPWTTSQPAIQQQCIFRIFGDANPGQIEIGDIQLEISLTYTRTPWKPHKEDVVSVNNPLTTANTGAMVMANNTALLNSLQSWGDIMAGGGKPQDYATYNPHAFANLAGPITAANIGTFMGAAAIGNAYIGNAAVNTLSIAGNAVTIPASAGSGPGGYATVYVAFDGATEVMVIGNLEMNPFFWNGQNNPYGSVKLEVDGYGAVKTTYGNSPFGGGIVTLTTNIIPAPGVRGYRIAIDNPGMLNWSFIAVLGCKR